MRENRFSRGTRRGRPPAWVYFAAIPFLLHFGLIASRDLYSRQPIGLQMRFDGEGAIVAGIEPGSAAERAGLRPGDRVRTYMDRPVTSRLDWAAVDANMTADAPVAVEFLRDGRLQRTDVATAVVQRWRSLSRETIALWVSRLVQLVCLAFGVIIVFKRPHDRLARVAALLLASLGVFTILMPFGFAHAWRELPFPLPLVVWPSFVCSVSVPLLFFVFCSEFPRSIVAHRLWLAGFCLPGLLMTAWQTAHAVLVVHDEARESIGRDLSPVVVALTIVYIVSGLVLLSLQYRRTDDTSERRRLRVLFTGAAIGCLAGAIVEIQLWARPSPQLTHSVFASPFMLLAMLLLLPLPASVAYTVLRHRLFDVGTLVRKGMRYALARRLLLSLVPVLSLVLAVDALRHRDRPPLQLLSSHVWLYAGIGTMLVTALVNRRRWLDGLDRRFFRERYHSEQVLRHVAASLRHATNSSDAIAAVIGDVEGALQPVYIGAMGNRTGEHFEVLAATPSFPSGFHMRTTDKLAGIARVVGTALELSPDHDTWIAAHLPPDEADAIFNAQVELLVPVTVESGREVLLVLGPRRSEEPYSREDVALLEAVASNLGLLLDRGGGPAAVTAVDPEGPFLAECPVCRACFDTSLARCPTDGTLLLVSDLPVPLAGRYRFESRLGEGGMGRVYGARDDALDRSVAVKVIGEHLVGSVEAAQRFRLEARAAASFTHPNVVTVHDVGVAAGGRAFLLMERLEGQTLREALDREGPLDPGRTYRIVGDVCRVLEDAHGRGLVHRDLKPENVFLARTSGDEVTKILDFGIAKVIAQTTSGGSGTSSGVLVGSLPYMSPEQLRGEPVSPLWDLWALGVMAVEMLTGSRPDASGPGAAGPPRAAPDPVRNAGIDVERFRAHVLAPDPAARPQTAHQLLDHLALALHAS